MKYMDFVFPEELELDEKERAAFSALAFRYPAGHNLTARRLKFLGRDQSTTEDVQKNLRRQEDDGFNLIINRLISKMSPDAAEASSKAERLERKVRALEKSIDLQSERQAMLAEYLELFASETVREIKNLHRYVEKVRNLNESHTLKQKDRDKLENVLQTIHEFENSSTENIGRLNRLMDSLEPNMREIRLATESRQTQDRTTTYPYSELSEESS